MMARATEFFWNNLPGYWLFFTAGPLFLLWSLVCLCFAGELRRRGVRVGYTRKVFHFLIFGTSVLTQVLWGTRILCLFGGTGLVVVLFAVALGDGHPLFEALARPADAPHRTYYVMASLTATLIGGLLANIFFGHLAVVGYLVAGLGDALGEPVGTRFGKHPYVLGWWNRRPQRRTLEGSVAVALGSAFAVGIAALLLHVPSATPLVATGLGLGVMAALVEAVSPHGWDNAFLQFVPTLMAWFVF